jgi:hypothetical protein
VFLALPDRVVAADGVVVAAVSGGGGSAWVVGTGTAWVVIPRPSRRGGSGHDEPADQGQQHNGERHALAGPVRRAGRGRQLP